MLNRGDRLSRPIGSVARRHYTDFIDCGKINFRMNQFSGRRPALGNEAHVLVIGKTGRGFDESPAQNGQHSAAAGTVCWSVIPVWTVAGRTPATTGEEHDRESQEQTRNQPPIHVLPSLWRARDLRPMLSPSLYLQDLRGLTSLIVGRRISRFWMMLSAKLAQSDQHIETFRAELQG